MNWLDWLIIALMIFSAVAGFSEGFIRIGIGFLALIVGFLAASWFHGMVAASILPFIHSKAAASVLGYLLIFLGVMLLGTLIAGLLVRMFKLVGLSWMDRLLGGVFGLVRGALVLVVVTLILTAFMPRRLPAAIHNSQLAPYVLQASRMLSAATPFEIKDGFERSYEELRDAFEKLQVKKKAPVRYE